MKLSYHIAASSLLGGVLYIFTNSFLITIPTILSGIFIDLDHFIDFFFLTKEKFTIKNFFSFCYKCLWIRLSLILHSWELVFLFCILYWWFRQPILLGIVAGTGLHMIMDQWVNLTRSNISKFFYFLSYRISKGFKLKAMIVDSDNK